MTESNQTSTVPSSASKKKTKIFYDHGKDALALALSVANMQEDKALRKAEKHHQPQVGKSLIRRKDRDRVSDKRKRLEETKVMIAERRAEAKKEKAKSRKESKGRLRQRDGAKTSTVDNTPGPGPRKRVSFA
ncbi:hypothetical protein HD554DRAFT_2081396 [Boletus coccyginus]|nr:hypothetical protein HD554DRAFT_2081396 [Boletus coccyginus]